MITAEAKEDERVAANPTATTTTTTPNRKKNNNNSGSSNSIIIPTTGPGPDIVNINTTADTAIVKVDANAAPLSAIATTTSKEIDLSSNFLFSDYDPSLSSAAPLPWNVTLFGEIQEGNFLRFFERLKELKGESLKEEVTEEPPKEKEVLKPLSASTKKKKKSNNTTAAAAVALAAATPQPIPPTITKPQFSPSIIQHLLTHHPPTPPPLPPGPKTPPFRKATFPPLDMRNYLDCMKDLESSTTTTTPTLPTVTTTNEVTTKTTSTLPITTTTTQTVRFGNLNLTDTEFQAICGSGMIGKEKIPTLISASVEDRVKKVEEDMYTSLKTYESSTFKTGVEYEKAMKVVEGMRALMRREGINVPPTSFKEGEVGELKELEKLVPILANLKVRNLGSNESSPLLGPSSTLAPFTFQQPILPTSSSKVFDKELVVPEKGQSIQAAIQQEVVGFKIVKVKPPPKEFQVKEKKKKVSGGGMGGMEFLNFLGGGSKKSSAVTPAFGKVDVKKPIAVASSVKKTTPVMKTTTVPPSTQPNTTAPTPTPTTSTSPFKLFTKKEFTFSCPAFFGGGAITFGKTATAGKEMAGVVKGIAPANQ